MHQTRCNITTQGSRIFYGQEWARFVLEGFGKAAAVRIDNIQEQCGPAEKSEAGKISNLYSTRTGLERKVLEEHHAIPSILGAEKYKYGKLIEDMKNYDVCKKDPFPKSLQKHVTYYPSGKITMGAKITTIKMSQLMVLPLQL